MPQRVKKQTSRGPTNPSGHLTSENFTIICAWLNKPSNYAACFGEPGSTTMRRPPASKENGFKMMATELNKQNKSGLQLSSKQMKEMFKTYKLK